MLFEDHVRNPMCMTSRSEQTPLCILVFHAISGMHLYHSCDTDTPCTYDNDGPNDTHGAIHINLR